MNSVVNNVSAIQATFIMQVALKLVVNVLDDSLKTVGERDNNSSTTKLQNMIYDKDQHWSKFTLQQSWSLNKKLTENDEEESSHNQLITQVELGVAPLLTWVKSGGHAGSLQLRLYKRIFTT